MQIKKQLEPDMEQQTGSKLEKEYVKAVYCHPVYLTYMQSTLCEIPSWMNHRLESRLQEVTTTLDVQMMPAESKDELKCLLMRVKEESEKDGLKLNIQKMKIMAFSSITLWQIEGEKVEAVTDLFLGSKITAAIKLRHLLFGRKVKTNLDSVLKSRDITLPTKVHIVSCQQRLV